VRFSAVEILLPKCANFSLNIRIYYFLAAIYGEAKTAEN